MAASSAQQQNRRIHELVEQSRDRVVHVRAGQSLLDVLDATQPGDAAGSHFPPPAASALVPQQRPALAANNAASNASDASGLRAAMRKRAAVVLNARSTTNTALAPALSSSEQFAVYAGSKLTQSESLNMLERRKAVPLGSFTSSSKQLAKLVSQHEATRAKDTPTSPLVQAVAAVKGRNAFLKLKHRAKLRTRPLTRETAKNTHMAFLEFKAAGDKGEPHSARKSDMAQLNASTREPLRFGDAVCMLSLAANLPLAVGRNGRTIRVKDTVAGPHMVFTVVDFRNPSRRDDVLVGEPFWLRIDASQLDVDETDEILALLVDTHYYLGGPGPLEEEETNEEDENDKTALRGAGRKYATRTASTSEGRRRRRPDDQSFKLVTMKASVPSAEFYGDDVATREYAVETNAKIVRLAQWRFTATSLNENNDHHHSKSWSSHRRRHHQPSSGDAQRNGSSGDDDGDHDQDPSEQLVLNCASVGLALGELMLEFDPQRRRGVLRGSLTRAERDEPHPTRHPIERRESCAWQVRLVKRGEPPPSDARGDQTISSARRAVSPSKQKKKPPPPPSSPVGKRRPPTQQESLEWLQFHHDRVEREAKRVEEKRSLAREAHEAYDSVAARSNAKLLQIEKNKAVHHREYFQSRFQQVVEAHERKTNQKTNTRTTLPRI